MHYPLGLCLPPDHADSLPGSAFDFLEVNVQSFLMPEKPDNAFAPHRTLAGNSPRPVRTANCFLPGDLKCVGPAIDRPRLTAYAETAFRRAHAIGIDTIVFGSGAARRVPEGWEPPRAFEDFVTVLRDIAPLAEKNGILIVVEPLHREECNLITSLAEGAAAVAQCDHPSVRLLADSYHMGKDGEPVSEIERFGEWIRHVHLAEVTGRAYPGRNREDFRPFFKALRAIGYTGRIALECKWDDVANELANSAEYLSAQADL